MVMLTFRLLCIIARTNTRGIKYTIFNELVPLRDPMKPKAEWDPCRGTIKLNIVYFIPRVLVIAFVPHLHWKKCISVTVQRNLSPNLSEAIEYLQIRRIKFALFNGSVFNRFSSKCGII